MRHETPLHAFTSTFGCKYESHSVPTSTSNSTKVVHTAAPSEPKEEGTIGDGGERKGRGIVSLVPFRAPLAEGSLMVAVAGMLARRSAQPPNAIQM